MKTKFNDLLSLASRFGSRSWAVFLLLALVLYGASYWGYRGVLVAAAPDSSKFSTNAVSGVRLSRYIDARPPRGRVSGMNAYADYLAEATYLVGERRGKAGFVDTRFNSDVQEVVDYKGNVVSLAIDPETRNEFVFGVQAKTRFKLYEFRGGLSSAIKNRWVVLEERGGGRMDAFLESITEDGVATIAADLPVEFFPTRINILPSQKLKSPATFALQVELTHAIRGGVVTTGGYSSIILRHLPYLDKIPLMTRFKYRPMVGDVVEFSAGVRRKVVSAFEFWGNYMLGLDAPIRPYKDSNDDIVKVIPIVDDYRGPQVIDISSRIDDDYFMGKERYKRYLVADYAVHADLGKGDRMYFGSADYPYVVDSINDKGVSVDLFETATQWACLRQVLGGDKIESSFVGQGGVLVSRLSEFKDSCRSGFVDYDFMKALMLNPRAGASSNMLIRKLFSDDWLADTLTVNEVFLRSLDVSVDVECKKCAPNSEKKVLPQIYGNGKIWEVYPGSLLNVYYGEFNEAEPEMMIHALGTELASKYYEKFEQTKPTFVAIAKPRQFTPWLYNWHWPFFRGVLANYSEFYSNSDFSIWYRNSPDWKTVSTEPDKRIPVDRQTNTAKMEVGALDKGMTAYSVKVRYSVKNPLAKIPVFGKSARALIWVERDGVDFPPLPPVSVPLSEKEFEFPVFIRDGRAVTLRFETQDPYHTGTEVIWHGVEWSKVDSLAGQPNNMIMYAPAFKLLAH